MFFAHPVNRLFAVLLVSTLGACADPPLVQPTNDAGDASTHVVVDAGDASTQISADAGDGSALQPTDARTDVGEAAIRCTNLGSIQCGFTNNIDCSCDGIQTTFIDGICFPRRDAGIRPGQCDFGPSEGCPCDQPNATYCPTPGAFVMTCSSGAGQPSTWGLSQRHCCGTPNTYVTPSSDAGTRD